MTQTNPIGPEKWLQRDRFTRTRVPTLSLRQRIPTDWHYDSPAYAGDPEMDWESETEQPREPRSPLTEALTRSKSH